MDLKDKMDYLTDNSQGKIKEYIQDLIKAYYRLKDALEDEKEAHQNLKEHSRPLTAYEESGMRNADFY